MKPESAQMDDRAAIKQLLERCGLPHADITAAKLGRFWVLRDTHGLVGVIGLETEHDAALLRSLAIAPHARGRGFGGRLLRYAETQAQSQGVRELYLLTEAAEDFFLTRGYRREERDVVPPAISATAEFRGLCPESARCMVKHVKT